VQSIAIAIRRRPRARLPNADRWGGPGASHEDRSKPKPDPLVKDADDHPPGSRKRNFEANDAQKGKA